jgi:hypothetical protein
LHGKPNSLFDATQRKPSPVEPPIAPKLFHLPLQVAAQLVELGHAILRLVYLGRQLVATRCQRSRIGRGEQLGRFCLIASAGEHRVDELRQFVALRAERLGLLVLLGNAAKLVGRFRPGVAKQLPASNG